MSTSGVVVAIGTANSDPESLLYRYYHSTTIPSENKIIYTWEEIYKLKKHISQQHADKYRKIVEHEIAEKGLHSTLIQTEWYANFTLTNDKFVSIDFLTTNNILIGDLEPNIAHYTEKDVYRVGSFDGAIKNDRASFVMGTVDLRGGGYKCDYKEAFVIKEAGENANPDDLIEKVLKLCITNQLDYLIVDNTANMEYLTIYLYENLKKNNCQTQILCFAFSGVREKVKMFALFESLLYNQTFTLPKYENVDLSIGFKYTLEELCQLKKFTTTRGEYTYKGIDAADFFDDFAMATAMFAYSIQFLLECLENKKEVIIGRIQYRLYLKKWVINEVIEKPKPFPKRYMLVL